MLQAFCAVLSTCWLALWVLRGIFTSRAYAGEEDLPALADLVRRSEARDRLDIPASLEELRAELANPSVDARRDVRLWEDAQGRLLAAGHLDMGSPEPQQIDGLLWFWLHPDGRNEALALDVLDWGLDLLEGVGREHNANTLLYSGTRADDHWRRGLLERQGFTPARFLLRMECALTAPLPQPVQPAGFTLRPLAGVDEVPAWVELYNQSFIDHWNHHPARAEIRVHRMQAPEYDPALDLVAVADDGTLAALCICELAATDSASPSERTGWVHVVGTRRGYRGCGLARALLLAGLHRLQAQGATIACLIVDAENPTGATRLYAAAGFQTAQTFVRLVQPSYASVLDNARVRPDFIEIFHTHTDPITPYYAIVWHASAVRQISDFADLACVTDFCATGTQPIVCRDADLCHALRVHGLDVHSEPPPEQEKAAI